MPESDHSRFWIAAEVSLGLTLVLLPMALGGAPEWTSWLLWALASAACILWAMGASRNRRRWGWHPVLLVPLLVALVGFLDKGKRPHPADLGDSLLPRDRIHGGRVVRQRFVCRLGTSGCSASMA